MPRKKPRKNWKTKENTGKNEGTPEKIKEHLGEKKRTKDVLEKPRTSQKKRGNNGMLNGLARKRLK